MTKTGYIYKIADKAAEFDEIYVGSTACLRKRKNAHKTACNNPNDKEYNKYKYQFIRENGGFANFDLYELEEVRYDNKKELLKKEREWIERLKPELNKVVPTRTRKEYYEDNRDAIHAKHKQYYEDNKDTISEQRKQYRENNEDTIRAARKRYYEDNKHAILLKRHEKHDCPCGGRFTHGDRVKHERTQKHQEYLSSRSQSNQTESSDSD